MTSPPPQHSEDLTSEAKRILDLHWREPGFCVPSATVYPWQWLWDSCFHSVCWAALGDERGVTELETALSRQSPDGFVPHMTYWGEDAAGERFWGRPSTSTITQPPMFGHAAAQLLRRGFPVSGRTLEAASRGLRYFATHRRHPSGLIRICHPWESGCDDSPRWDDWCPGGFEPGAWKRVKGELVDSLTRSAHGDAVTNPAFDAAPVGFTALVAFNAAELAPIVDDPVLHDLHRSLVDALETRWEATRSTWVDAGKPPESSGRSGSTRTLEGLLPALVVDGPAADAALDAAADNSQFGGMFGPAGVHRHEPAFDPHRYWRGPAWPQLTYLMALAAERRGRPEIAAGFRRGLEFGAAHSGFAEHWHPDTGEPGGAVPQTWACLAVT